ncbi:MAG: sigma 54-interacting transcriptional regulator [Deltaproteobacteria bacterium]|jgi:two-component system, NtrC family, response regulator HydG|nr:sigma 54-interacting transcriptional regulator [Deltaproteobacteria bacterium]
MADAPDKHEERMRSAGGWEAAAKAIEHLVEPAYVLTGTVFTNVNQAMATLLGYDDPGDLIGRAFIDIVYTADWRPFEPEAGLQAGGDPPGTEIFRVRRRNGTLLWVTGAWPLLTPGDDPPVTIGSLQDISALKAREAALQESEENYKTVLDGIEDGYIENDLAGNTIFINEAIARIFEAPRERLIGLNYREMTDQTAAEACYIAFNDVYSTGVPQRSFIFETLTGTGRKKILEYSISLKKDSRGMPIGFRSIVRDITERKRAEEDVARQRSRLKAIFRSVRDAIITVDTNLEVIEANQAAATICGFDLGRIVGKVFTECPVGCGHACHEVLQETLNRKTTVQGYQIECAGGSHPMQKVDVSSSPLLDSAGRFMGAVLVIRDITRINELEKELEERHRFQRIIGKNRRMQEIYKLLEDLADLETTVLVTGESGTGKELVAKALHNGGNRAFKPFVTVNCSALAENLLESELFGHVKGAFTGAVKSSPGRFETADGGTIFLDEIGDISPLIQLKLLRFLQEKTFERVGDPTSMKADVRIIACTNRDLKSAVAAGSFREDLYYRLKVVEIALPPLRERLGDIPLLVDHFRRSFNRDFNKEIQSFSDEVLNVFMGYNWPGNVRELEHTVEHAFVLCHDSTIDVGHLPREMRDHTPRGRPVEMKSQREDRHAVERALGNTDWNVAKAARNLGISRRTIYRRIDKYGLARPR